MKYEFDSSHEKYIEVTASGILRKIDLITAVSELMQHPDYLYKHSLWVFSDFSLGIGMDGLGVLTDTLRHYIPKETEFANKSALMVSGQAYEAILSLFVTMAIDLPFEFRSFTDKDKAVNFLCLE